MKVTKSELKNIIKEQALKLKRISELKEERELLNKQINEHFDDEELPDMYTHFDPDEFSGDAMKAAQHDIEASGEKFTPLGQHKYEKGMNPDEFKANISRAQLDLPNDKKHLDNIRQFQQMKSTHEKKFGHGSLNEKELSEEINAFNIMASMNTTRKHTENPTDIKANMSQEKGIAGQTQSATGTIE